MVRQQGKSPKLAALRSECDIQTAIQKSVKTVEYVLKDLQDDKLISYIQIRSKPR